MKSLIGKEWRDAKDGSVIEVRNPATNELVDTVPSLSVEEVNEAVDYAYEAQKEWEKVPVHERCAIMMKFVSLLTKKYEIPTVVSLNTIMVDGTGMCGACRITVGGKTKFVCVDGPEFDAHQVDFDEMLMRLSSYKEVE